MKLNNLIKEERRLNARRLKVFYHRYEMHTEHWSIVFGYRILRPFKGKVRII